MGQNISGQSPVQQQNNQQKNLPKDATATAGTVASFQSAAQPSNSGPLNQAAILTMLMELIGELISSLQVPNKRKDDGSQSGSGNQSESGKQSDSDKAKKADKTAGTVDPAKTNATTEPSKSSNSNTTTGNNTSSPSGMPSSPDRETTVDTGVVYKGNSSDQSEKTAQAQSERTAQGPATQPASLAGKVTTDYNAKFNIDPSMRDCPACINEFTVDQTHTASSGVPYRDPTDHIPTANRTDREWGEVTINNHFQNTFNVPKRTAPETYKGGTLTIEVSRPQIDPLGPNNSNDSAHIVEGGSSIGGESLWTGKYANQLTRTLTFKLTPAQAASANDGTFSFLVEDDTTVHKAELHLDGGTPIKSQNGTTSDDDLKGKSGAPDIIHGLQGDDTIDGESGDDCLHGDEGDDHIRGGSGNDKSFGGSGDDTLISGSGDDKAFGGLGDDKIFGGSGEDIIFGDEGDDELHGGSGNDTIYALDGNDTVFGDSGDDHIYSGLANTTGTSAYGPGSQHNEIDGGSGEDTVHYAGTRDDYIITSSGNGEWEVQNKDTNKIDIVKHVEHLSFEMEMDPLKKVVDLDTGKSK